MARLLAIGDVHGCLAALDAVLDAIRPQPDDELVMLGDYVDRGPDSRGVIDRLIALDRQCELVPLLGNHEEMMLATLESPALAPRWLPHGGVQTLSSYDFVGDLSAVPQQHRDWLRACRQHHVSGGFMFVHANYDAFAPMSEQPAELLRWTSLDEQMPGRHTSGLTAIVGHTAQHSGEVLDAGHLRCLDTFCYGGGWLSAMDLGNGQLWQADRDGRLRESPQ